MNKLTSAIIFVAGAAVGSIVTWALVKNRYADIAQEEIDSVKEAYTNLLKKEREEAKKNVINTSDMACHATKVDEYGKIISECNYASYNKVEGSESEVPKSTKSDAPYVISPDEYGEFDDYMPLHLTYYQDEILADDQDNIVENVDEVIGNESLLHFGDYEDALVHVRNDKLKCDYEIDLDERMYYGDIT